DVELLHRVFHGEHGVIFDRLLIRIGVDFGCLCVLTRLEEVNRDQGHCISYKGRTKTDISTVRGSHTEFTAGQQTERNASWTGRNYNNVRPALDPTPGCIVLLVKTRKFWTNLLVHDPNRLCYVCNCHEISLLLDSPNLNSEWFPRALSRDLRVSDPIPRNDYPSSFWVVLYCNFVKQPVLGVPFPQTNVNQFLICVSSNIQSPSPGYN